MSELIYRRVEFNIVSAKFQDLIVFTPELPVGANWGYFGQVAYKADGEILEHGGLIALAKDDSDALGDIVDWEPVFVDIEQGKFSTWRGIPADPENYVSGGDFFVVGTDKPTEEQTVGIRSIRKDLIGERQPNHLVWEGRLPKAILSIWNIGAVDRLHVATGAFASTGEPTPENIRIPVLRFNA